MTLFLVVDYIQEAQLPQRNSASATHVCVGGWLIDRVIYSTPQMYDKTWPIGLAKDVSTLSANKKCPTYVVDDAFLHHIPTVTSCKLTSLCVIRKQL